MKISKFYAWIIFASFVLTGCSSVNGPYTPDITFPSTDEDSSSDGLGQIKDDIQVTIVNGVASSAQPGEGIERSWDNDMSTLYHSSWTNVGTDYFPITLTYYFDNVDIDYFVYYPRNDGGVNGCFKEVEIEILAPVGATTNPSWTKVKTHDFGGVTAAGRVEFPITQTKVQAVRLTVKSGAGDGQGFASCAEMKFYKRNPDNFDWSTLFTDASCSELKPGVVSSDIKKCSHIFFRDIAQKMNEGIYDKEFRIDSFKAYPHPEKEAAGNKTNTYSLLDNPTGISVKAGEYLIVMADLQGQTVNLRIQNLNAPGSDGFGGVDYPLSSGVNKLLMESDGLAYVMFHTDKFEMAPPVKLHFATGEVSGYYDSQRPDHKGRGTELLAKATDKYFDLVGKYSHLTFPTERFRRYTPDLDALINAYDEMVYAEQQLMGLEKYDKMFHNRMYFHVMYWNYMYSTNYHTAYHDDTLSEILDVGKFTTSSIWGPAHEVGHCNQTRPGMLWKGMTEVTNNIMSQYVQTTVFNQPSRVQSEDLYNAESPNRYSKAWNTIVVPQKAFCLSDDVFCQLIPFWQLELYFGKTLGLTPKEQDDKGGFYPDCYEYVRTHSDLNDNGALQLEFAYIASVCAKTDLTDFFEKWGFFTPVDKIIDDYGEGRLRVTPEMADRVKQRIKDLGFESPNLPLEYITDFNYEYVKKRSKVITGNATLSSNRLTMQGWENVMAFEVREKSPDGSLIHVSDGRLSKTGPASFEVKEWKDTYKVYAVQCDGERIEVIF